MKFRFSIVLLIMAAICFLLTFVNLRFAPDLFTAMFQKVDSTQTKGKLIFSYTGMQLALGQEPTFPKAPEKPAEPGQKTRPDSAAADTAQTFPTMNNQTDPFRTVQATVETPTTSPDQADTAVARPAPTTPAGEPKEQPQSATKPNIYAMLALILILASAFVSSIPRQLGLLLGALGSTLAVLMLNLMKMNFGTYLMEYMQLEAQYMELIMQYFQVEFTPYYWAVIVLVILAFLELVVRLLTGMGEPKPVVISEEAIMPESLYQDITVDPEAPADQAYTVSDEDAEELPEDIPEEEETKVD